MSTRNRQNFYSGVVTVPTTSALTLTGTNFPTVPAGSYMAITLNPGYYGSTGNGPEVIWIGPATSSTVASVLARNAEANSTSATGTNIPWVAGPLAADFDVSNLTSTGTLTLNNGFNAPGSSTFSSISGSQTTTTNFTVTSSVTATGTAMNFLNSYVNGIPKGRMYASTATQISGTGSATQGYNTVQTVVTGTYGFTTGGVTFANNALKVPIAGYYQISASLGYSYSSNLNVQSTGIYGGQIGVYNSSGVNTGYYIAANSYLANSTSPGAVPETIVFSDIVYLGAGYQVTLIGYNGANTASTPGVFVGAAAAPQTTYLSLNYVGS